MAADDPKDSDTPTVVGAPTSSDGANDIVVKWRDKQISFAPFGGSIEAKLKTGVFYESEMLEYIEALGLAGTYVDVGGYVGTHALFFATYCKATDVHTFEPRVDCYQHLTRNIRANKLDGRVAAHQLGVSDKNEPFSLDFHGKVHQIDCRRLDDLIQTPVAVMKIDVEGMEPQVLAGATRILSTSKPLLFIEAHTPRELEAQLDALSPFGYRLTGRVFNASPTYEFAAPDSPTAGDKRLPRGKWLLDREAWHAEPGVTVEWNPKGSLVLRSRLEASAQAHVTQLPLNLCKPPASSNWLGCPTSPCFVQIRGKLEGSASLFVMAYDDRQRIGITRHRAHARVIGKFELPTGTKSARIVIRMEGSSTFEIDELWLHEFVR